MPASCADLRKIGHIKSGFYSIMGKRNMETVHCNFAKQHHDPGTKIILNYRLPSHPSILNCFVDFQKVIGYVDVKSGPVYFHAQSTTSFSIFNKEISYNLIRMNVGNAIHSNGLFVAPKSGKYFFAFSGLSGRASSARVEFQMKTGDDKNWIKIGHAYGQWNVNTLTIQNILQLGKGDQIRLILQEGSLHSQSGTGTNHGPSTTFAGWIMEEDIF